MSWTLLLSSSVVATTVAACGTVFVAAVRADELLASTGAQARVQHKTCNLLVISDAVSVGGQPSEVVLPVNMRLAAMSGVAASAMLVLLFYFFHTLSWLLLASSLLSGTFALFLLLRPALQSTLQLVKAPTTIVLPHFGRVFMGPLLATVLALLCGLGWLWTGNWLLNNLLGMALAVLFVAVGRLPSLKVAVLLLSCLLLYDVFWVYASHTFFGENVMTAVAQKESSNPIAKLAEAMAFTPPPSLVHRLSLPSKLIFPSWDGRSLTMLGLGDIALPGMLVALYYRAKVESRPARPYFISSLVGYTVGLQAAMAAALVFDVAQPALLFLVPATIVPAVALALVRGEFTWLWHGYFDDAKTLPLYS